MRFYTVPDAKTAQFGHLRDGFHWLLYLLTFILGFGAMVLWVKTISREWRHMAAPMLAEILGGNAFLGFIAAVSFATILAL